MYVEFQSVLKSEFTPKHERSTLPSQCPEDVMWSLKGIWVRSVMSRWMLLHATPFH